MLRCRGYIFFGSTLKILNDVMGSVVLPPELQPTLGKHKSSVGSSCASLDSQPGGGMGSSYFLRMIAEVQLIGTQNIRARSPSKIV